MLVRRALDLFPALVKWGFSQLALLICEHGGSIHLPVSCIPPFSVLKSPLQRAFTFCTLSQVNASWSCYESDFPQFCFQQVCCLCTEKPLSLCVSFVDCSFPNMFLSPKILLAQSLESFKYQVMSSENRNMLILFFSYFLLVLALTPLA